MSTSALEALEPPGSAHARARNTGGCTHRTRILQRQTRVEGGCWKEGTAHGHSLARCAALRRRTRHSAPRAATRDAKHARAAALWAQ